MSRNKLLDIIKGISIILVILCHTTAFFGIPTVIKTIIEFSFLRLFFFVSGCLLFMESSNKILHKIKSRFFNLLFPYITYSVLAIVWDAILVGVFNCREISENYFGFNIIKRDVFCFISGLGIGTLWFLPVLFIAYSIAVMLTNKITKDNTVKIILCIIIFEIIGYYIPDYSNDANSGFLYKVIGEYVEMLYRILYGTASLLFGYLTCMCCPRIINICIKDNLIVRFLCFIGQYSLEGTIIHYIILLPVLLMCLKQIPMYLLLSEGVQKYICFILLVILTSVVVYILSKTKFFLIMKGKRQVVGKDNSNRK